MQFIIKEKTDLRYFFLILSSAFWKKRINVSLLHKISMFSFSDIREIYFACLKAKIFSQLFAVNLNLCHSHDIAFTQTFHYVKDENGHERNIVLYK